MSIALPKRIFLSSVSSELRSYRLVLANHLANIPSKPEIRVQEDFQQGGATLLEKLAEYVRSCDLVIHLVGSALGFCPTAEHERELLRSLGEPDTTPTPGCSATQWEYHLARRFGVRTLVYVASDKAPRDCGPTITQAQEAAAAQSRHRDALIPIGKDHTIFDTPISLLREVFRDLGLEPDIKISNLPFASLGSLFKGRDEFLQKIRDTLGSVRFKGHKRAAAITSSAPLAAVHGLGGVGKTRVAVEFAHQFRDDYTALLFIAADSGDTLNANLAALCGAAVLNLPEQSDRDQEVQVAATLNWLRSHPGWLAIFDNVDSEQAAQAVDKLVSGLTPAGHVIVTSRLGNWSGEFESLQLDVLSVPASVEFMLERTDNRRRMTPEDPSVAEAIAIKLGQLALALEQAGANISHERLTLAQYLTRWEAADDGVIAWFDERVMKYPRSVATTWQASFERLTPAARKLLAHLSWLAPDPIPESLLGVPVPEDESVLGDRMAALADLEAYSLAQRSDSEPTFSVHRLVQDVMRRRRDGAGDRSLRESLGWMNEAFVGDPTDVRFWPLLAPLLPHALRVSELADKGCSPTPTMPLLSQCGLLLYTKALYVRAEPLMRRVVELCEQNVTLDHSQAARALSNLAQLLQTTNRSNEAEPLYRRAQSIIESSCGVDHPDLAVILNNLAGLLQSAGRLLEAEPLRYRVLDIFERSLGKYHPQVATALGNLALLFQSTNRHTDAGVLFRRSLAIFEAGYGESHPKVATGLNNLAGCLHASGQLAEAERLLRRAVAIDEASFGMHHPDVARDINNLASVLQDLGRHEEAESLYRRALAIDEAIFGCDHPIIAIRLNNLASLLQGLGRLSEAEPLYHRAVAVDEISYGKNHPSLAIRLSNLATMLYSAGRFVEAEPRMRRALEIFLYNTASNKRHHPHLHSAASNYATLLKAMGKRDREVILRIRRLFGQYGMQVG